jgi:eukaryotic-like serine/threonine-protein kinase
MNEETLFQEALSRSREDRAAFLKQACEGQTELVAAVEALLAAHEKTGNILDRSPTQTVDSDTEEAGIGATLDHSPRSNDASSRVTATTDYEPNGAAGIVIAGRYTLQEKIGDGGMGEVWVAKQTEPVKRTVALKLIKTGMDSRAVLQRFEQERQALALMDHPNIAKVLDGGLTPTGQPFFVMELVNGLSLSKFCDDARLTTKDRLELFVPICQAVQHAHQKGIVHRDLKPANILVTIVDGKPVPKVIDFGVAKAIAGKLTDESMSTQFGAVIGTLEYMSPEQAGFSGIDVDTRADIYSLGVILYELLSGLRPFDPARLRNAPLTEMIRIIREEDPSKPSTRLSTDDSLPSMAALRQTEPRKLMAILRGELDWVVMKCLEKRRERRYETANGLARDIQRYLADETVEARPPSAAYRVRKFLKRNKGPVVAASLLLLALLLGIAGTTIGFIQAEKARDAAAKRERGERLAKQEAQQERDKAREAEQAERKTRESESEQRKYAQAIAEFVRDDFLALTSVEGQYRFGGATDQGLSKDTTLRQLLDRAAGKLSERKDIDPLIESELNWIIGVNYRAVGDAKRALPYLERCVAIRQSTLGPDAEPTLNAQNSLAVAYRAAGDLQRALPLSEKTLAREKNSLGPNHPSTLNGMSNLAWAYQSNGQMDKAMPLLEETLKLRKAELGPDNPDTLTSMNDLASGYRDTGELEKAIALFEETVRQTKAKLGPDHPKTLVSTNNLAEAYQTAGKIDMALPLYEETLRIKMAKFGPDSPNTLRTKGNLASAYLDAHRFDKALPLCEETLKQSTEKLGRDHPETLTTMNNLALGFRSVRQFDKALRLYDEAMRLTNARFGPDHARTLTAASNLASAFMDMGQPDKAFPLFEETLRIRRANLGPNHADTLNTIEGLAWANWKAKRFDKSVPLYEDLLKRQQGNLGRGHPDTQRAVFNLGVNFKDSGRPGDAIPLLEEAYRLGGKSQPPRWFSAPLLDAYTKAGKLDKAIALNERIRDTQIATLGPDNPETLRTLNDLAAAYWSAKHLDKSVPLFEDVLKRSEATLGRQHPGTQMTVANLGVNYMDSGRLLDAIPLLEEAYRSGGKFPHLRGFGAPLLAAYTKAGRSTEAAKLLPELLADARKAAPEESPQLAATLAQFGLVLCQVKAYADAEPLLRECLAIREKTQPDLWNTFTAKSMLGGALLGEKKYADAEPLLIAGYEGMKQREETIPPQGKVLLSEALDRIVQLYDAIGKPDQAAKWRKKQESSRSVEKPTEKKP